VATSKAAQLVRDRSMSVLGGRSLSRGSQRLLRFTWEIDCNEMTDRVAEMFLGVISHGLDRVHIGRSAYFGL
jgi:hypothetical protein